MADDALERRNRINQLMDFYGELLTDRQRQFIELHVAEDHSFGEIAEMHKVSRQAVHDSVKHGEQALEEYEAKLNLLTRLAPSGDQETQAAPESAGFSADAAVVEDLKSISQELKAGGGIVYNADEIARKLDTVIARLSN